MRVAFDYAKTLVRHPDIRAFAKKLQELGIYTAVISAVSDVDHFKDTINHLEKMGLKFNDVKFVLFTEELQADGAVEYRIGLQKLEVMNELGCTILIDDNVHICRAIRDAGLTALHLLVRE